MGILTETYSQLAEYRGSATKQFGFECSMIDQVERFVRGFGGEQVPYIVVSRRSWRMRVQISCAKRRYHIPYRIVLLNSPAYALSCPSEFVAVTVK